MTRFGLTTPEATMSLGRMRMRQFGLPRIETTQSLGGNELALVAPVINRSLGASTASFVARGAAVAAIGGLITAGIVGMGFASYKAHGSPMRAGLVVGSVSALLAFTAAMISGDDDEE